MQAREIEGNSLAYILVEPDDYDENQEYPAVVLLHGFGASMRDLVWTGPGNREERISVSIPKRPDSDADWAWHDWIRLDSARAVGRRGCGNPR